MSLTFNEINTGTDQYYMNEKVKNTLQKVLITKKKKDILVLKGKLQSMPKPSVYKIIADSFL